MAPLPMLYDVTVYESPLHKKMSFLRKYIGAVLMEFITISTICTLIMLSPIARFYIAENDWLVFLSCFLVCASLFSLMQFIQLPVVKGIFIFHIILEAFTLSVIVTHNDWMVLYQAILVSTCCIAGMFLYTLQSKWDFHIWVFIFIYCSCAYIFSTSLRAVLGGTKEEGIISSAISFLILFYHCYAAFMIMITLSPADILLALINAHTLFLNFFVHSTLVYKPTK